MAFALPSFAGLFAGALRSLRRFPLPVICAGLFTLLALSQPFDIETVLGGDRFDRIMVILPLCFLAALAAALFAEARFWPAGLGHGLGGILVLLLLALTRLDRPQADWQVWNWHWVAFLAPALVLTVMVASTLGGGWDNKRFWDFNRAAWLSVAFAWLAAAILNLGLQATTFALDALLEIDIDGDATFDIAVVCFGLLWPWLALAGLPRRDSVGSEEPPRWLRFLVHWLLVPLVITYLAVIYAYIVKILVQWELPDGEVGWVISSYAAVGVAVQLIAAPWRTQGAAHVRAFQRWFYPALFAPAAVLALAVWIRIRDYGITEPRYLLALVTLWLFFLAVVHSLGVRRLALAPLSLALLLLAATFGPWSAGEVSARSQLARLESALTAAGLLEKGKVTPAQDGVDFDSAKAISGGMAYLVAHRRQDLVAAWFPDLAPDKNTTAQALMAALNVRYVEGGASERFISFYARMPEELEVAGFQRLYLIHLWDRTAMAETSEESPLRLRYDRKSMRVTATDGMGHAATVDLAALTQELLAAGVPQQVPESEASRLVKEARDGPLRLRVIVLNLNGRETPGGIEINGGQVQALIGTTPAPTE